MKSWGELMRRRPAGIWLLLCGMLMTLGFAPFELWPVAIFSLAVLVAAVRAAAGPWQALGATLVWGLGHQLSALYWLPWAFFKDSGGSWLAAIGGGVPALLGVALYGALCYAVAAVAAAYAPRRWREAVFVLVWLLVEVAKGLTPYGFPWLPVGMVWANSVVMMQLASVGGVYLLSLLVLLTAVLVSRPDHTLRLVAASVLLLAVAAFGVNRLHHTLPAERSVEVRVVQPDIQSESKWDPLLRWQFLQRTLDVGLNGEGPVPPTVVMPESAVAFYLNSDEDVRRGIAARLPKNSVLVTGTVRYAEGMSTMAPRFYNSMAVIGHDAVIHDSYDKHLLVPFGEFLPLRQVIDRLPLPWTLRTLSQSRIDFSPGSGTPLLRTPAGTALGLICYEGIFPLYVARHAAGADYLLNITNDNWFTGTIALYQHASLERMRAVENGRPLVRVANTGISVVYDSYGREVERLPINTPARMDVKVPLILLRTPFRGAVERVAGF
ncbi:MAG: apolipoprotein N-acyltransferase [Proteobacteria bacterium]|nr:apolipoprotein N-acyltransferase [Pseudomonadota bacterium]